MFKLPILTFLIIFCHYTGIYERIFLSEDSFLNEIVKHTGTGKLYHKEFQKITESDNIKSKGLIC